MISYIYIILITSILPFKESNNRKADICRIYGNIFIEKTNRNLADASVYVEPEETFADMNVFIQENELYADQPGMWHLINDPQLADFIIFVESEKERAKYRIHYTDTEFYAGCR